MEKLKVSIIVPVYNVEKYLEECISSIIKQNYKNIEIILIDDGSKDSSGKICDEYAKKDKRIRVIHQKNSGVSTTRNKGIELATGDYIAFIDSDDYIDKDYIKYLVGDIKEKQQIICKIIMFNKNERVFRSKKGLPTLNLNKDSFIELSKLFVLNTPCCKLYNRKILKENNLAFDTGVSIGEDLLFNLAYLKHIDEVVVLDKFLYFYRRSDNNTLSTVYNPLCKDISIRMIDTYTNFFKNIVNKADDLEHFDTNRLYMVIDIIQNEFRNKEIGFWKRYFNARHDLSDDDIKSRIKDFKHTKEKLYYFLLSHNMCLIYKIVDKIRSILKSKE